MPGDGVVDLQDRVPTQNVVSIAVECSLSDGKLDSQNIVNRHFKPLLRRAGLPDIRWHDLRQSCFTILLKRGTHPKYVQHLAGHSSITMTLDRYSHWIPSMGRATAAAMDAALVAPEEATADEASG